MPNSLDARVAGREALALATVLVIVIAGIVVVRQRPAGPDEVKIAIGELRSQAAELALFDAQATAVLPPRFIAAHGRQLARVVDASREKLDGLEVPPSLAAPRAGGLRRAAELVAAAQHFERARGPLPAASAPGLEAAMHELQALERTLRR
jgi:hypothetical protein